MDVRAVWNGLIDLVAPWTCPGCDAVHSPGVEGFCEVCSPLLEPIERGAAAFEYGGPMADAIRRLKYANRPDLAGPLGRMLAEAGAHFSGCVDAVVPVPLHARRRRERGFDQAALLAKPVARLLDVPLRVRGLVRLRHTPPQAERTLTDRLSNMQGAFTARRWVADQRILLIDDVQTTGATLSSAKHALNEAGAAEVYTLALAATV